MRSGYMLKLRLPPVLPMKSRLGFEHILKLQPQQILKIRLSLLALITLCCAACTSPDSNLKNDTTAPKVARAAETLTNASTVVEQEPKDLVASKKCIEEIAGRLDETVDDGWFFGEEPRLFKSFYRKIAPSQKADFAVDYHYFLKPFHENLVNDYKSYVPYSKRADFAMVWWAKRVPRFVKSELKQKVLWVHESIQDAGELWWRAKEKLNSAPNNSIEIMAHDEEQRMVCHFTEHEGSPGTIADQIWKREHETTLSH